MNTIILFFILFISTIQAQSNNLNDCSNKLLNHFKNPLNLIQLNGYIINSQFDDLILHGINTVSIFF